MNEDIFIQEVNSRVPWIQKGVYQVLYLGIRAVDENRRTRHPHVLRDPITLTQLIQRVDTIVATVGEKLINFTCRIKNCGAYITITISPYGVTGEFPLDISTCMLWDTRFPDSYRVFTTTRKKAPSLYLKLADRTARRLYKRLHKLYTDTRQKYGLPERDVQFNIVGNTRRVFGKEKELYEPGNK